MNSRKKNQRQTLEQIKEEIFKTCDSLMKYNGYADKRGSDYADGWTDAIEQISIELLGRKEQDGTQLLLQAINNLPSSSKEIYCEFCDNYAIEMTPGADAVCKSCGNEILDNLENEP